MYSANPSTPLPEILRAALVIFIALSVFTGLAYPFVVTLVANAVFPQQAAGSLIERDGNIVGSELIGQAFSAPHYFWGRPSATTPMPYNAAASNGSNLGPRNLALAQAARARIAALQAADPDQAGAVPVDLVTASGSGLDPHISPASARYQIKRVARARNLPLSEVEKLVVANTNAGWLSLLGEPTVNVLLLNLALDKLVAPH